VLRLRPVVGKFRTPSGADADSENEKISRRQVTVSRYYHRTLGVQFARRAVGQRCNTTSPSRTARPATKGSGCFALYISLHRGAGCSS
jgi:hypothetical protein